MENIEQRKVELEDAVEARDPRRGCCHGGSHFFSGIKAMLSRIIFLLHGTLLLVYFEHTTRYYFLAALYVCLITEALVILIVRRGHEWKWYSPSMLIYLCLTIPILWIIEDSRQQYYSYIALEKQNLTATWTGTVPATPQTFDWTWTHVQIMLVAIIVSRWLMPKGEMSRDELSALLIMYLASAADIVDFFDLVEQGGFIEPTSVFYGLLAIWSWSMLQFPFVRTALRELYSEEEAEMDQLKASDEYTKQYAARWHQRLRRLVTWCFENETWGLLISIVFQDGPFLVFRVFMLVYLNSVDRDTLFFVVKNALVIVLQIYRIMSLGLEHHKKKQQEQQRKERRSLGGRSVRKAANMLNKKRASGRFKVADSYSVPEPTTSEEPTA